MKILFLFFKKMNANGVITMKFYNNNTIDGQIFLLVEG